MPSNHNPLPEPAVRSREANRLLTIGEAAKQLGIGRTHIYALRRAGRIRFSKLLKRSVVTQAEIDRLVASIEAEEA